MLLPPPPRPRVDIYGGTMRHTTIIGPPVDNADGTFERTDVVLINGADIGVRFRVWLDKKVTVIWRDIVRYYYVVADPECRYDMWMDAARAALKRIPNVTRL